MINYNGESYMESYTDEEHDAYWGDSAEELEEDDGCDD